MKKRVLSQVLVVVGCVFIVVKAIDYFVPGKALIPGLTLIGLLLVAGGLLLGRKV